MVNGPMVYPWQNFTSTCGRCNGPWGQNCIDGHGHCLKVRSWWDSRYSCACCGNLVDTHGPTPEPWDGQAWKKIQAEHSASCPWATTFGYRVIPHEPLPRTA
jgi:hypothetical protein